jgi:4-hydroxyphenylpyruvate dioxygenase
MGDMTNTVVQTAPTRRPEVADLVLGWDHIEWWVGNARAVTAWLTSAFGFTVTAYEGPETGASDRVSYLLTQGDIRYVVTAGLTPDSPITRHVGLHGDGIRNLAWRVIDSTGAAEMAQRRGATVVQDPHTKSVGDAKVTVSAIATYGETRHLFVERDGWPGFDPPRVPQQPHPLGLDYIDHVVGNVEEGRLDEWVSFYEGVLGFDEMTHFDAEQISTQYSALRSTVVHNGHGVTMPINEPAPGLKKSQITEYLEAYRGPGVQHIALGTRDIVQAVDGLHQRGVRCLEMPAAYYDDAKHRAAAFDLPWADLQRLDIEVDVESGGYLLQIFTETMSDRPTLFHEIIQREGASGFGEGNFKALFEALEQEQARRGNL